MSSSLARHGPALARHSPAAAGRRGGGSTKGDFSGSGGPSQAKRRADRVIQVSASTVVGDRIRSEKPGLERHDMAIEAGSEGELNDPGDLTPRRAGVRVEMFGKGAQAGAMNP